MIYDNILDTIGDTPVVKLRRTGPEHVDIYVKIEAFNPAASVKDRLAYTIIHDAEEHGEEDERRAELVKMRSRLEGLLATSARTFQEFGKMLPEKEQGSVEEALALAKAHLQDAEQSMAGTVSALSPITGDAFYQKGS